MSYSRGIFVVLVYFGFRKNVFVEFVHFSNLFEFVCFVFDEKENT